MDTPADRLRNARELRGFPTPTEAAQAFGWNEVTYRAHENGGRGIKQPVAEKYASAFRVKAGWILFGDGEAPGGGDGHGVAPRPASPRGYLAEPNVVFEGQAALPKTHGPSDIQELGITVGGFASDDDAFEMNGQVIDMVKRPIGILDRKDVFALRVSNDSMAPKYEDGERVYVEKRKPAIRDYVVIELKPTEDGRPGKSFIKRLVSMNSGRVTVEQFNPAGRLEFDANAIKQILRVIPERELRGE
jgi:phage repressor protein C with HTH and peptisase S24 domain